MLTIGVMFTAVCSLRYFRDDRGYTIAERGIERLRAGRRQTALRILAVIFAMHLILTLAYNLPNSVVGAHSRPWPADLQKRSYLTDGICGEGTDRMCPAPGVPLPRGNGSAYIDLDGQLVVPAGTTLPAPVPLDH